MKPESVTDVTDHTYKTVTRAHVRACGADREPSVTSVTPVTNPPVRMTEALVIVLGHLTEAQRRAYRIADNKLTELGSWDEALLSAELNYLLAEDFDLSLVGFSDGELDKLLAFVPEGDGEEGGAGAPCRR